MCEVGLEHRYGGCVGGEEGVRTEVGYEGVESLFKVEGEDGERVRTMMIEVCRGFGGYGRRSGTMAKAKKEER